MGSGSPSCCRKLGLTLRGRLGVCLGDNQGSNALGALDARFCGLLGMVSLAFKAGMFSI